MPLQAHGVRSVVELVIYAHNQNVLLGMSIVCGHTATFCAGRLSCSLYSPRGTSNKCSHKQAIEQFALTWYTAIGSFRASSTQRTLFFGSGFGASASLSAAAACSGLPLLLDMGRASRLAPCAASVPSLGLAACIAQIILQHCASAMYLGEQSKVNNKVEYNSSNLSRTHH